MDLPGYTTPRHPEHDVSWMVVSASHSGVVCVACLVEQLEDASRPHIQRRVVMSVLAGLLRDGGEVAVKFGHNLLLSRHIVDIITDQFFSDDQYVETSVEVCGLILECAQSEDLVWYTIDKFHYQLQNTGDLTSTTPYLLLLGQLLVISPAYGFHLLDKHESLLLLLIQLLAQTPNENCQCSVIYIFIQLFDDQLKSDMSDNIRSVVCRAVVTMLSDGETLDLRVNLLALLKKIVRQASSECISLLMAVSCDNKSLVMGLKKMFITKQEVLQTVSAQCVQGLVASSREGNIVGQILDSDLAEFLFESLHTQNGPQLNSVYQCLQTLTTYDQFFTRCHAVYGVESILRSLTMVLEMKNFGLTEKGFCLLACILNRQPQSIPLFVNVTSVKQCVQLVKQGLNQSHPAVFFTALTAAQALVRKQYIPWPSSCEVIQDMVKMASTQMSSLCNFTSHRDHIHGHTQPGLEKILTAFVDFISSSCRLCCDNQSHGDISGGLRPSVQYTISLLVSAAEHHLMPYILSIFDDGNTHPAMKNFLDCFNILMTANKEKTGHMCLLLTECGVLGQAHVMKYSILDQDLCETVDTFLHHLYHHLLSINMPWLSATPDWLLTGISKLKSPSLDVSHLLTMVSEDEDLAWTTLTMIYFSCLHHNSCVEGDELQAVVHYFLSQCRDVTRLPPLIIRCLTFLAACSSGDSIEIQDSLYGTGLSGLIEVVASCPTELWFTHHPVLICWVFSDDRLVQHLGHSLMEHWLPLIDLTAVTHKDKVTVGMQDSEDTRPDTSTPGDTETHSETGRHDNTDIHILEDLAHSHTFFSVLLSMLVGPATVASTAMTITDHLVSKVVEFSVSGVSTVTRILETCHSLFHQLFLQDSPPQEYQVCYLLRVMTRLMRASGRDPCVSYSIKAVYHVVKYFGGLSQDEDSSSIKVCLEYLLKYTEDPTVTDCLCIGPVLTQNKDFMLALEKSLTTTGGDLAARLVAWLADTTSLGIQVPHQIHISHSYLLDAVTTGLEGTGPGALGLLSASLAAGPGTPGPGTPGPVVFSRETLLEDTPLFTVREIRTLYFHLQQLVCQDSKDMFTRAVECIHRLYKYASSLDKSLAHHLSRQSWNSLWFETLLHMSFQHGVLIPNTLQLINMLLEYPAGQQLLGTSGDVFLQMVLKLDLQTEQIQTIGHILSQCKTDFQKTVKPEVLQQVHTHLQQAVIH